MDLVTPSGFRDVLSDEASEREDIQRRVQDLFAAHGFKPVETPTLEVMDVMKAGGRLPSSPFRFFDSQGDLLAMRPDVTLQIARMCATRLRTTDECLRFRYTQRVFRESEGKLLAAPREMTQIGIECIGDSGVDIDTEIVRLFLEALALSGVAEVCLAIATVGPLRALLARSGGSEAWRRAVMDAYHGSDLVELDRLTRTGSEGALDNSGAAPAYAQAISALFRIRGGLDAVEQARQLTEPLGCADGLNELAQIVECLTSSSDDQRILVDFSAMSSFDYYTGVVFEAYSPYLGAALGSGGRYDNMASAYGEGRPSAGFAFCLEQVMAAQNAQEEAAEEILVDKVDNAVRAALGRRMPGGQGARRLRIAVPKGALNEQAIECLEQIGLDTKGLEEPGRQLVIATADADYIIVRPSDAPVFVASGAADCGICGRDSLLESGAQVVELVDLGFGGCRFVVAEPVGAAGVIDERYRRLGSVRVATKYPNITLAHFARTGVQVDIVKLNGNIELAPLTGMAERIVDITATGTTLRENDLIIVEEVLSSTARFFANPCSLRTNDAVMDIARKLEANAQGRTFDPIAGKPL